MWRVPASNGLLAIHGGGWSNELAPRGLRNTTAIVSSTAKR